MVKLGGNLSGGRLNESFRCRCFHFHTAATLATIRTTPTIKGAGSQDGVDGVDAFEAIKGGGGRLSPNILSNVAPSCAFAHA